MTSIRRKPTNPSRRTGRSKPQNPEAQISDAVAKAITTLYPRMRVLETYDAQLQNVDQQMADIVKGAMRQASVTYWSALFFHAILHLLSVLLVGSGLYFLIAGSSGSGGSQSIAIFCIVVGIIALIAVLARSPLKNVRNLMMNAMKLNIVYAGYTRQIHQVDAAFKNVYTREKNLDHAKIEELMKDLQDAIDEATTAISEAANDME